MKISRLKIEDFAIDECPKINQKNLEGNDFLFRGGNRSGKTLVFNAILYGLYGNSSINNISPGRSSSVEIYFDNTESIDRGGSPQIYRTDDGEEIDPDIINSKLGPEDSVQLQFINSNVRNQPLSDHSGPELVEKIREALNSSLQQKITYHNRAQTHIDQLIDREIYGEGKKGLNELESQLEKLNIDQHRNRINKIEHLLSLVESGEIHAISDRLQEDSEQGHKLNELYDKKRTLEQKIGKKSNRLDEARRYTKERVNELIVDAVREVSCPVCDRIVEHDKAKRRLKRNDCPHCGRDRPYALKNLRADLQSEVDSADERIEELESQLGDLDAELEEINEKIDELQSEDSKLRELNSLVRTALKQADHSIGQVEERAQSELEALRETVVEEEERKEGLEDKIKERKQAIEHLGERKKWAEKREQELVEESYEEVITRFRDVWSVNHQEMSPSLSSEIELDPEGNITAPGTTSGELRDYDELSTGERRVLNLSFAYTLAELATNEETHNCEVLVMDEPLAKMGVETQDRVLDFLLNSDIQCIITSSDVRMESKFRTRQVRDLERIELAESEQVTLQEAAND
ncbi:AAA family ATPase [Halobacteriales archaeon QS_4_62_28]|nr:MAG: AAA family ATPase [Halobacteriales archaeon QS_4_62_28]